VIGQWLAGHLALYPTVIKLHLTTATLARRPAQWPAIVTSWLSKVAAVAQRIRRLLS